MKSKNVNTKNEMKKNCSFNYQNVINFFLSPMGKKLDLGNLQISYQILYL